MPRVRPAIRYYGASVFRFWVAVCDNGGWSILCQTPIAGFHFSKRFPAIDRDGISSSLHLGAISKWPGVEGDFLYRFEKEWIWASESFAP